MDRDKRWERVQRAYDAADARRRHGAEDALEAVAAAYAQRRRPTSSSSRPSSTRRRHRGRVEDGDALIFFNFRADRARQITDAFDGADFDGFARAARAEACSCVTHDRVRREVRPAGRVPARSRSTTSSASAVASAGLTQLRIAETEKYAHVTFFFNGGARDAVRRRGPHPGPVAARVATYDLKPEMSRDELTDTRASRRIDVDRVRRHHHELRERRHGRPHRRHAGGGGGGRTTTDAAVDRILHGDRARGRRGADHRRSRQRAS